MLANSLPEVQAGRLDPTIHLGATARLELLAFIAKELPKWRDHPARPSKRGETSLTEHLCDHLNSATCYSEAWSHVQFRTETGDESQTGRKIDLSVKPRGVTILIEGRRHSQFDALLPIECKRLPTPSGTDRDEREYVITEPGTTGGIQRFKFGHHGAAHRLAAVIAYVEEQSFSHWLARINGWITDLSTKTNSAWNSSDSLREMEEDSNAGLCMLSSSHKRRGGLSDCELRHLWIRMN